MKQKRLSDGGPSWRGVFFLATACFLVVALRKPCAFLDPHLWVEDGVVYLREQGLYGWRAVLRPYSGYLQLFPRLVAAFASLLPPARAPLVFGLAGAIAQAAATSFFFHRSNRFLLRPDGLRALVSLIVTAISPPGCGRHVYDELLGTAVNTQWHLFAPGLLLLAQATHYGDAMEPLRRRAYALAALLIGLSTPLLIVAVVPIAAWGLFRRRGGSLIVGAFALSLALQCLVFVRTMPLSYHAVPVTEGDGALHFLGRCVYAVSGSFLFRVVLSSTVGWRRTVALAGAGGLVALAMAGVFSTFLVWLLRRLPREERRLVLIALAFAGLSIAIPLLTRRLIDYFPDFRTFAFFEAPRYFQPGTAIFVWIVALAVDLGVRPGASRTKMVVLAAAFAGGVVANFRVPRPGDVTFSCAGGYATVASLSVGDFNGDGRSDVIAFTRDNPAAYGDVYVALSKGTRLRHGRKWHDWFAVDPDESVVVGDFDGDGRDDVATWLRTTSREVYVALSLGERLGRGTVWLAGLDSRPGDVLLAGDADGDGRDDLVLFARQEGRVEVARSSGTAFDAPSAWHERFAASLAERPVVADVDGDRRADIVSFATDPAAGRGDARVALSTGSRFESDVTVSGPPGWFLVRSDELVRRGHAKGSVRDGIFILSPSGSCETVLFSGRLTASRVRWPEPLPPGAEERSLVGDFNGDGKADVLVFPHPVDPAAAGGANEGAVLLSLAP